MQNQDGEIHVTETEASGGSKEGVVRWVLLVGLVLAIGLLSIIWMTGAATQDESESTISVTENVGANAGDTTDSIVSEGMDEMDAADPDSDVDASANTIEN